jgi:hypothetical protein
MVVIYRELLMLAYRSPSSIQLEKIQLQSKKELDETVFIKAENL